MYYLALLILPRLRRCTEDILSTCRSYASTPLSLTHNHTLSPARTHARTPRARTHTLPHSFPARGDRAVRTWKPRLVVRPSIAGLERKELDKSGPNSRTSFSASLAAVPLPLSPSLPPLFLPSTEHQVFEGGRFYFSSSFFPVGCCCCLGRCISSCCCCSFSYRGDFSFQ